MHITITKNRYSPIIIGSLFCVAICIGIVIREPNYDSISNRRLHSSSNNIESGNHSATTAPEIQQQLAFEIWNHSNNPFPCIIDPINIMNPPEGHSMIHHFYPAKAFSYDNERLNGILYVKLLKTASSTLAGVNTRIATNYATREMGNILKCKSESGHEWFLEKDICRRDKSRSFLWTFIRDPTDRAVSEFFHLQVSRKGIEATDDNFSYRSDFLASLSCKGLNRLSVLGSSNNANELIENVLNEFNFIGITERFDESLVALQLILGLQTSDILYLPAKSSGGYDDGHSGTCNYIQPTVLSPDMKHFLQSEPWLDDNKNNYLFYNAVNRTLDRTIAAIGFLKFDHALRNFMLAKKLVNEECTTDVVKFPCTKDGIKLREMDTDCYKEDWGCGYACIDGLMKNFTL